MITRKGIGRNRRLEVTSKERAARRRRVRRRRIIILAAIIFVILGGIIGIFHLRFIRIDSVAVSGVETISAAEVTTKIRSHLDGAYWYLVPHDSIFFYPKRAIEHDVLSAYPDMSAFSVNLSGLTHLSAKATERHEVGEWCDATTSACYFLDADGYVYAPAPQTTGGVYFMYSGIFDNGTTSDPIRATYLAPQTFHALNTFLATLQSQHIFTPLSFERTSETEGTVATADGVSLLISLDSDFGTTLANLTSALNGSSLRDPAVRSNLEYIDLRFGDKLYYKLKGDTTAETPH